MIFDVYDNRDKRSTKKTEIAEFVLKQLKINQLSERVCEE